MRPDEPLAASGDRNHIPAALLPASSPQRSAVSAASAANSGHQRTQALLASQPAEAARLPPPTRARDCPTRLPAARPLNGLHAATGGAGSGACRSELGGSRNGRRPCSMRAAPEAGRRCCARSSTAIQCYTTFHLRRAGLPMGTSKCAARCCIPCARHQGQAQAAECGAARHAALLHLDSCCYWLRAYRLGRLLPMHAGLLEHSDVGRNLCKCRERHGQAATGERAACVFVVLLLTTITSFSRAP